jgi:hypothetical protein
MKHIKVTEKSGASITYAGDDSLISRLSELGHGKPERWVLHKDELMAEAYDDADVLEEEIRELTPAVEAILDEQGVEVSPAVPAVMQKWVKLKAEYTVEIEDITAQHALAEVIAKRVAEYPSAEEFLNAYFDGGQAALDALQASRLAVKAKYPKP